MYAEVITMRQNLVAVPSSVEKLSYAALEHPNQVYISNLLCITDIASSHLYMHLIPFTCNC